MSEETETLIVYVRGFLREWTIDAVAFTVPKGWRPSCYGDLERLLAGQNDLPEWWRPYWADPKPQKLWGPYDACETIAKMPRGYDPDVQWVGF